MTEDRLQQNRRILLVDDTESIHDDIRKILSGTDANEALDEVTTLMLSKAPSRKGNLTIEYELDSAYQGQDGVAKVEDSIRAQRPYAVAFVDMRMPPGWDGIETIERIWKLDPNIQIVICSAHSDYSWEETIERLGQNDRLLILKKPFEHVEIRQLACALTNKWNLGNQLQLQLTILEETIKARTAQLRAANQELQGTNQALQNEVDRRAAAEVLLQHQASHDALTDLPNRTVLTERLAQCLDRAARHADYAFAVLFLDLDDFKLVNDSLGHEVGDALLIEAARRLRRCVRSLDAVSRGEHVTARLGGDEFVIVLDGVRSAREAVTVAERIQAVTQESIHVDGHDLTVSSSIGITVCGTRDRTVTDLLREADTAMYRAKAAGKGQYAVFDKAMHAKITARVRMENELRDALGHGELDLHYQPIVEVESSRIVGLEALARWTSPVLGRVPPDRWIPIAEDIGIITEIGEWIMRQACGRLREWQALYRSDPPLTMNVNVSRRQLSHASLLDDVPRIIAEFGIEPATLHLEITETTIMYPLEQILPALRQLKNIGVALCMDDFGTGQSSLACLHEFPLDVVKIDRAFLVNMQSSRECAALNQAIITLAHNLNLQVVAEGVETAAQLAQLRAMKCDYVQGFLFAKPMPADMVPEVLSTGGSWRQCA